MTAKEVIYFANTSSYYFNNWEYYQVDKEILEQNYSKVFISHDFIKTFFLIIKKPNADIFCWWWHTSFPIIFLSWLFRRNSFCTGAIHMFDYSKSPDYYKKNFIFRSLTNISLRLCKTNIFISKDQFLAITSHINVTNPKVIYSSLGLKRSKFPISKVDTTKYLDKNIIKLLFLGWLDYKQIKRKSLLYTLKAVSICINEKNMNIQLTIAGKKGSGLEIIKEKIKQYKLTNFVQIKTNIDAKDKNDLYLKSDLLVMPSHMEGFGNASLEAMSFGCPSIASRYGASPEVIGESGFIINFINSKNIAKALVKYSNLSLRQKKQMRIKAFERSYSKFTFQKRSKEFRKLFNT